MRWPLQPLQPFQQTQLQPSFGQSVDSLCHPWFTTTNVSYRFPILKLPPPPCAVLLVFISYNWQSTYRPLQPTITTAQETNLQLWLPSTGVGGTSCCWHYNQHREWQSREPAETRLLSVFTWCMFVQPQDSHGSYFQYFQQFKIVHPLVSIHSLRTWKWPQSK